MHHKMHHKMHYKMHHKMHHFCLGLTDLISLRACWCVSIGACFMQRKKLSIFH